MVFGVLNLKIVIGKLLPFFNEEQNEIFWRSDIRSKLIFLNHYRLS